MLETYVKKILSSRVYEVADETPLTRAANLSRRLGVDVRLKREDLQPVFSFKLRGAYNKISQLSADQLRVWGHYCICWQSCSRGRYGRSAFRHQSDHCDGPQYPSIKVNAVRARGAKVILHGDSYASLRSCH